MFRLTGSGLLILILAVALEAQAVTFSFPFPGSSSRDNRPPPPGPGPWQFRPQDPSSARGMPPGYPPPGQPPSAPHQMPGQAPGYQQPGYQQPGYQQPGYQYPRAGYQQAWPGPYQAPYQTPYGQQRARRTALPPRIELTISEDQPYVQENVLVKLRVVSEQNLETATPELPNSNDVLFQKVQGPEARSRSTGEGGQEIVNEFVYSLTPLRAGNLDVPPLRVSGTMYPSGFGYGQTGAQRFEASSQEPIRLQVRPAMASVRPWLPLKDLALKATLDSGDEVEQGQPVTLTLELKAMGATGSQLPSLESQLTSPDFRVYREQTLNESWLSSDGRNLEGRRTEYYTLVPRSGGKLRLPEMRIAWWNVLTGTREYASLPIRTLEAEGETGPYGLPTAAAAAGGSGSSWIWLPLAGLMLLLLGYWGGVWLRGLPALGAGGTRLRERWAAGVEKAGRSLGRATSAVRARMDPTPLLAGMGSRLRQSVPPSTRFLLCVDAANREDDPAAWAERFAASTCRHLDFASQAQLPGIADKILALRPGADREQLVRLLRQLDGALYGNQDIDFARWKKQFRRQIGRGRGLAKAGAERLHLRRARLPELNPQVG